MRPVASAEINAAAHATAATTGPAAAVMTNAKEKLKTMSRTSLLVLMEVKSAGTALTLRKDSWAMPSLSRSRLGR